MVRIRPASGMTLTDVVARTSPFVDHRAFRRCEPAYVVGDARWVITFNGEIYNFEDIRAELRGLGINCRGRSDTEVLVEALARSGPEAIAKVDGMFAFAAFNQETGELFMARDPFGEKPLYYAELKAGGIAFASELQALEHVPAVIWKSVSTVFRNFLLFNIWRPRTIYRSIRKLAPGHWLRASAGKPPEIVRFFGSIPAAEIRLTSAAGAR